MSPDGSVNLSVVVEKLTEYNTSQSFTEESLKGLVQNHTFNVLNTSSTQLAKLPANTFTTLGSFDFSKFTDCPVQPELQGLVAPIKLMMTSVVRDDKAYTISYGTVPFMAEMAHGNIQAAFSYYMPVVKSVMSSFKFINDSRPLNDSKDIITDSLDGNTTKLPGSNQNPCDIIRVKYASGEITKDEFVERRDMLKC